MGAKILQFPRTRARSAPPPVNPWAEAMAWSLSWWGEVFHMWSAMLRQPR